jgi:hypothetical protein
MEASLHRGDAGSEDGGDFRMAAAFLDQSEECPVLRPQLLQSVAEGVKFLGIHRSGRLGHVFVLGGKGEKDPPELLAAEMVDAGVAGEPEKPRLELSGSLKAVQSPNHLDENLLGDVFDRVAPARNGVNKPGHAMLVADNEVVLRPLLPPLCAANEVDQCGRFTGIHAGVIASRKARRPRDGKDALFQLAERLAACNLSRTGKSFPGSFFLSFMVLSFRLHLAALGLAALLAGAGCNAHRPPDELATAVAMGEKPVSMSGDSTFFGGKLHVTATVSQGIGKGGVHGGKGSGRRVETTDTSGMNADEATAYFRAKNAVGSPMPPVTLRLRIENTGGTTESVEVVDFDSDLGNFAVHPSVLAMAPAQIAEPDPMISQLGVTSDSIPVKVTLRMDGAKETQTIIVKSLLGPKLAQ